MRHFLPLLGWVVGMFLGAFTKIESMMLVGALLGIAGGFFLKKYLEEEEDNQWRAREAREKYEREEASKAYRRNQAIELARKYPEATKQYFKQHWGIVKYSISDSDITNDKVDTLLSHRWSYEKDEQLYNAAYKAKVDAEREAARRREEAQREAARRAEEARKRAEEEERRNLPITLPACVSSWYSHTINGALKHKWFVDYYPYNKYKDCATYSIKEAWNLVWNFKNDDRISSYDHTTALNKVVNLTVNALKVAFGNRTKYLTFVCLTASTKQNTTRRFEEFSKRVCSDLSMENGLAHIRITQDAIPKHLGGNGIPQKSYDQWFFSGKYVILFDDVRTSGSSIIIEKNRLESMGATVIGVITIAQTKS